MARTVPLARRQLLYKPLQLAAALGGVAFASMLVLIQGGLMLGMLGNASCIIDHSDADLWVMPRATPNFDFSRPMGDRRVYRLKALPGVARADVLSNFYSMCRTTKGEIVNVMVVGIDPDTGVGGPWSMKAGRWEDVREPDGIIINESDCKRLGVSKVGDEIEINNRRAKVVAISREALNFSTAPNIFVSRRQAGKYNIWMAPGLTATYFLVKAKKGVAVKVLKKLIAETFPDLTVLTREEFSFQTKWYWMTTTGIGMLIGASALLGLLVGMVVVAQILYSSTVEYLPQYAVMKALGATDRQVSAVLMAQGIWVAVFGFPLGWLTSVVSAQLAKGSPMQIFLPWWLVVSAAFLVMGMCVTASLLPARKLSRLEPGTVFRA